MNNELQNLKKFYKWYLASLIFAIIATIIVFYLTNGLITVEFVIGVFFISFLSSVVYIGAMIIQLKRELDEVRNGLKDKNKKITNGNQVMR